MSEERMRLCVFCGSSFGVKQEYADTAKALAQELVRRDIDLVYGGGDVGLMGVVANSVMETGGKVIGVMPKFLADKELASNEITELRIVTSMHERKAMMSELSSGFIALPGGFGTFEELFEVLTWQQLGIQHKPVAVLNVCDYYSALLQLIEHAVDQKFIKTEHKDMVIFGSTPAEVVDQLLDYQHTHSEKWIDRDVKEKI